MSIITSTSNIDHQKPPFGSHLPEQDQQKIADLKAMDRLEIKFAYWDLATPAIRDIDAEYGAILLSQGDRLSSSIVRRLFSSKGPWLGKGFRPLDQYRGEGYNVFGTPESRRVLLPMDTYIGGSHVVDGSAYILDYRNRNRGAIRWLRGELRVLSENLLLGIGAFGPWKRELHRFRRTIPFILARTGPSIACNSADQDS